MALPAALFACSATAQAPPLLLYPEPDLRIPIPPSLGGYAALRLVDCDLDGDMLRDACILWDNGEATLAYAPEVLSSFAPFPTLGIRDIARVPIEFAAPAHPDRDGILLLDGNGVGYVTLAASPSNTSASGLTRIPVVAPTAWFGLERLEVQPLGEQCWVLGLAPASAMGSQAVRLGQWTGTEVVDLGCVTASAQVQQMRLVPTTPEGLPNIVVRTNAGLQMWAVNGQPVATLPAPTTSPLGALTPYQVAGETRLAWLAMASSTVRLRTLIGAAIATDVQLTFDSVNESLPPRFRPTGMDVLPALFGGQDGLVLYQNTQPWHIALEPDAAAGFAPICGIEVPQLTTNTDNCPSVLMDLDRDGHGDVATVLTSLHCLQYAMRVSLIAQNGGQPLGTLPLGPDPDYLGAVCQAQANEQNPNVLDTLDLQFVVPDEFLDHLNRNVQVVAWPQDVGNPTPAPNSNLNDPTTYEPAELGAPLQQYLYDLPNGTVATFTLRFPLPLEPTPTGQWNPYQQAFLMLRLVEVEENGDDGPHVVWSSPPQLVGFVGGDVGGQMPAWNVSMGFMQSLSEPQSPATTSVMGNPNSRQVGVLLKPLRIRLPSSTVITPSPAGAATGQVNPQ